jgi:hypothetical protein
MSDEDCMKRADMAEHCQARHKPIEESVKDLSSRLWWIMCFVLITLGGVIANLAHAYSNGH